jgi:hypothetical protein
MYIILYYYLCYLLFYSKLLPDITGCFDGIEYLIFYRYKYFSIQLSNQMITFLEQVFSTL